MFSLSVALLILLFCFWFKYERDKASRKTEQSSGDFWKKELDSNQVRRKDLSKLPYLKVSLSSLPFSPDAQGELLRCQNTITGLADRRILKLTGITNTELKTRYGTANLTELSAYDENFTLLCRTLNQWAGYLLDAEKTKDARAVLEYAVSLGTDIGLSYRLLAGIYQESGENGRIRELLSRAEALPELVRPSVMRELEETLTH